MAVNKWVYKTIDKRLDLRYIDDLAPICPKCHYVLIVRKGEHPKYCPMCGFRNADSSKTTNKSKEKI